MFQTFLDFFFPRRSLMGTAGEWITEMESQMLLSFPVRENKEQLMKRGLHHLDGLFAATDYRRASKLRELIKKWKYGRIRGIEHRFFSEIEKRFPSAPFDAVLCPVPLHWTRRFERGFNQAESLSRYLSSSKNVPMVSLLKRVRPTGHQAWRRRTERLSSMTDAFRATGKVPARIILIDDLSTTGATLNACAEALKKSGAKIVEGWVIAHG